MCFDGNLQHWNDIYKVWDTKLITGEEIYLFYFYLFRYIYVCYAADLISKGEKLFNVVMTLVILTFSLQWVLIFIVEGIKNLVKECNFSTTNFTLIS